MHKLYNNTNASGNSRVSSDQFYGGELRDGPGVLTTIEWHECKLYKPFVFYDVQHGKEESSSSGFSWINEEEALCYRACASAVSESSIEKEGPKLPLFLLIGRKCR